MDEDNFNWVSLYILMILAETLRFLAVETTLKYHCRCIFFNNAFFKDCLPHIHFPLVLTTTHNKCKNTNLDIKLYKA